MSEQRLRIIDANLNRAGEGLHLLEEIARLMLDDAELTKHGKVHEFHSYPGANHAFMNARVERYHAEPAQDSWPKTLAFFEKYLGKVSAASG